MLNAPTKPICFLKALLPKFVKMRESREASIHLPLSNFVDKISKVAIIIYKSSLNFSSLAL